MDFVLLLAGILCLLVGLAGAVLPLPGPPLSFAGLLILQFTRFADFSNELLIGLGVATAIITVLDYYVPVWGTKKFGGTKAGARGSTIGLLIGMFLGPSGIFIGAFLGALLGELVFGDKQNAFKAALGSFFGFAAGILMKVILCLLMIFYAGQELFQYFR